MKAYFDVYGEDIDVIQWISDLSIPCEMHPITEKNKISFEVYFRGEYLGSNIRSISKNQNFVINFMDGLYTI